MTKIIEITKKNNNNEIWTPRLPQKDIMRCIKHKLKSVIILCRQSGKTELLRVLGEDAIYKYTRNRNPYMLVTMQTFRKVNETYFQKMEAEVRKLPPELVNIDYSKAKERAIITVDRKWRKDPDVFTMTFGSCSSEHVANNIRGNTLDILFMDEAAFYPRDVWSRVFEPMLDDTGGIAILTSTVDGPNYFMDLEQFFKTENDNGSLIYGHYNKNIYSAGYRSDAFIEDKKKALFSTGQQIAWYREYMNDYYSGVVSEYPFGEVFFRIDASKGPINLPKNLTNINFAVDRGSRGNMATFGWVKDPLADMGRVIYYEDDFESLERQIIDIYERFKEYKSINITYPNDILHPSILKGSTEFALLNKFIQINKLGHKIQIHALGKVANKMATWNHAVLIAQLLRFDFGGHGVRRGYDLLCRFRFNRDPKSGKIIVGTPVRDKNQHAADAMCYLALDWEQGFLRSKGDGVQHSWVEKRILDRLEAQNKQDPLEQYTVGNRKRIINPYS